MEIKRFKNVLLKRNLSATVALLLVLSFAVSLITALPAVSAQTAVPDRYTGAYISVNPPDEPK